MNIFAVRLFYFLRIVAKIIFVYINFHYEFCSKLHNFTGNVLGSSS
ncbi:hypothetical protein MTYM_01607 [Methylococcales bacterium]|nr:hypothetical protein MTYM_01607 [Methylococcales bacterium]